MLAKKVGKYTKMISNMLMTVITIIIKRMRIMMTRK